MIEAPFADLVLGIMQNASVRWVVALLAALWVWIIGDEDARGRNLYIGAPLAVALVIQLVDSLVLGAGGKSGWLDVHLAALEALARLASVVGLLAILGALVCGFTRMIGGVYLLIVLMCAFAADQLMPQAKSFFSAPVFAKMLSLAPAVLIVLLTAYGLGATLRYLRERSDVA